MLKKCLIFLFFLFSIGIVEAQNEDAWVFFKDKPSASFYLNNPIEMLSQRSIDRRLRHQILFDEKDIPIELNYIQQIKSAEGVTVMAKSKWLNALHVIGSQESITRLLSFNFIDRIEFANKELDYLSKLEKSNRINVHTSKLKFQTDFAYGKAENQIEMLNGDVLHKNGFTGEEMQIAIIDAGFPNVDKFDAFKRIRENNQILGGYNYVQRNDNIYSGNSHGMSVLSTISGYIENEFVGTAPDAKFYLFITEDNEKETPLEESLWVEAVEKADSLGVDVINSSLGYATFDNSKYDYSYNDMDGKTTFISRGSEIAFSRGMIILNSAGNEGNKDWKYIIAPADASSVLSIGAVNEVGEITSFSSFGPTSDERLKPDVCAQGGSVYIINSSGNIATSNGTSFSSPVLTGVVACLWQAFPEKNNKEIIDLIKKSSSLYSNPNTQEGYGIPNFEIIYNDLEETEVKVDDLTVYPNPSNKNILFKFPTDVNQIELLIYNSLGQLIYTDIIYKSFPKSDISFLNNGLYLLHLSYNNTVEKIKLIKE